MGCLPNSPSYSQPRYQPRVIYQPNLNNQPPKLQSSNNIERDYATNLQGAAQRRRQRSKPKLMAFEAAFNEQDMQRRYGFNFRKNEGQLIDIKVPTTTEKIKFTIIKQPVILLPFQTGGYPINIIKNLCFQEKMTWSRIQVQKLRISWEAGCQWLNVDREDILMSSLHQLQQINLRKEVKIKMKGQEVDDAGGVLRQWMHLCMKDIFNNQISGLFKLCKTDQTAYRFVIQTIKSQTQDEYRLDICNMLGFVVGKALFDRIPLDCFFTRSIWRQICGQPVQLCDFYSFDEQMYRNFKCILDDPNADDLGLNFTYYIGNQLGKEQYVILKPDGDNITVTDANKKEYITLLINHLCVKSCQRYIKRIKAGINKVIPLDIISIFQPHQMEMLLNGPQHIDVKDWRNSTQYINYSPYDKQILWFWNYLEKQNQQKLGNLLHFVTGSRRVPILGFGFLESNRNKINKFTIQKVNLDNQNPYPKGHTCFNRLQLPLYKSQEQLIKRMNELLANQINTFGMS